MESLPSEELTIYEDTLLLLTDTRVRMTIWAWTLETNQHALVQGWWDAFQSNTVFADYEKAQMVMMVMNLYGHDVVLKKPPWSVRWCMVGRTRGVRCCPHREDVLYVGDKVFVRFSHKRKTNNQPFVYTLAVDHDHSFTVNGYIVKNCSGATPDTMVMSGDRLVPIARLRPGESRSRYAVSTLTARVDLASPEGVTRPEIASSE